MKTKYDEDFQKRIKRFLEQMKYRLNFEMVQEFLESMPKLSHTVKFINPNTDVENTVVLEGLQNFFRYAFHMIVCKPITRLTLV